MQKSLTLDSSFPAPREERDFLGRRVPWEIAGYSEDYQNSLGDRGLFDASYFGAIEISGPDAQDFLQRLSTTDFRQLRVGELLAGCFLNGRSHPVAQGWFFKTDHGFLFVLEPHLVESTASYLEMMHFAEQLEIRDASPDYALFGLWGTADDSTLRRAPEILAMTPHPLLPKLVWVLGRRTDAARLLERWRNEGAVLLGQHVFEYYRILNAIPRIGTEVSHEGLALEGGLAWAIAENKGCYPGQEVVERIRSYGRVNRSLRTVWLSEVSSRLPVPLRLDLGGRVAVQLVSECAAPNASDRAIGLAYVNRAFENHADAFELPDGGKLRLASDDL